MSQQEDAIFGVALRLAFRAKRRTQSWLADELHTDPGQVSRWVNNRAQPRVDIVRKMEQLLGTDFSETFEVVRPAKELFVSAPINGLSREQIDAHRLEVERVVRA